MKKKKLHTVPKSYLENFSDEEGKIWVLNLAQKRIFQTGPENVFTGNYFYKIALSSGGATLVVEDTLADIEGKFAEIFNQKIKKKLPLTLQERAVVAIFIASMMLRTKSIRRSIEKLFSDVIEMVEHVKGMSDNQKKIMAETISSDPMARSIPADEMIKMSKDIGSVHSETILANLPETSQIIFDMRWEFLIPSDEGEYFLTSDNPCQMLNAEAENGFGYGTLGSLPGLMQSGVDLTLPLSPKVALLAGWGEKKIELYFPISKEWVKDINYRSSRHANEALISRDKGKLEELIPSLK